MTTTDGPHNAEKDAGAWPEVPCDEYGQMTCPITGCGAGLYLTRSYCIPLIAEQAAHDDHEPNNAITDRWEVACTNDHRLRDCRDQLRETPDEDETADYAPEYDHMATHHAIARLTRPIPPGGGA